MNVLSGIFYHFIGGFVSGHFIFHTSAYAAGPGKVTGSSAAFSLWILHMAFIILISNMWGMAFYEWKGVSRRTKRTIFLGIFIIMLSVLLVGRGNSMMQ